MDRLREQAAPCRCMMNEGVSCIHPTSRAVSERVGPHALRPVSLRVIMRERESRDINHLQ